MKSVAERPSEDLRMSATERALYLETPIGEPPIKGSAPWRVLARQPAVWAYIVTHFATTWSLYMLLSWLPSYFREGLGLSIKNAGFFAAAPWVVNLIVSNSVAQVADKLVARGMRVLLVRRALIVGGLLGLALFLLSLREVRSPGLALVLVCIATGFLAVVLCGSAPNTLEIAPKHASLLMGVSNTIATLPGRFWRRRHRLAHSNYRHLRCRVPDCSDRRHRCGAYVPALGTGRARRSVNHYS